MRAIAETYTGTRLATQNQVIGGIGPLLAAVLDRHQINTVLRIAHFLAQMCAECEDFTSMEEAGARPYFAQYNGRNGNIPPDDGYIFRGRGLIQLTFRDNYARYGKLVAADLVNHPDLASEPETALLVACAFWTEEALNGLADADDILAITKRINGGLNGIEQRRTYLVRAKQVLAPFAAAQLRSAGHPPAPDSPILHSGSSDTQVADVQRLLAARGFRVTIDGEFGPGTEAALKTFQAKNGLPADGIVGPGTWTALRRAGA